MKKTFSSTEHNLALNNFTLYLGTYPVNNDIQLKDVNYYNTSRIENLMGSYFIHLEPDY